MTPETRLGRLYLSLSAEVESSEEEAFEDLTKYNDKRDRPDVIGVLTPLRVLYDEVD